MVTRRKVLAAAGGGTAMSSLLFHAPVSAAEPTLADALERSRLVYISPIRSVGNESRCHSEVLFVTDRDDVYVCSREAAWRINEERTVFRTDLKDGSWVMFRYAAG